MSIHTRIKELRKGKNLTQEELGNRLEISRSTIANWELDATPEYQNIKKLADFFEVSIDYLLNGDIAGLVPEAKIAIYSDTNQIIDITELSPEEKEIVLTVIKQVKALHSAKK